MGFIPTAPPGGGASGGQNQNTVALSSVGTTSLLQDYLAQCAINGSTVAAWPVANTAIYIPVWVTATVTAYKMATYTGTPSGNYDFGIYTEAGTRLVSLGSTAMGAGAGTRIVDIADTVLPGGATYYLALAVDNLSATFTSSAAQTETQRTMGIQSQTSAFPLPATATFANPASAYVPTFSALCAPVY